MEYDFELLELPCDEGPDRSIVFNLSEDNDWVSVEIDCRDGNTYMVILDKDSCSKLQKFLSVNIPLMV